MRGTSGELRHPRRSRFLCSLPGLAGFAGPRCTEPEVPRFRTRALHATAILSLAQRSFAGLRIQRSGVHYDFGFAAAAGATSARRTYDGVIHITLNRPAPFTYTIGLPFLLAKG